MAETPDPIDVLRSWWFAADYCSQPEPFEVPVSQSILDALTAAGFQVVPIVDDETREDVLDAVRHAKDTLTEVAVRYPSWGSELRLAGRTLDDLTAAYLGRTD